MKKIKTNTGLDLTGYSRIIDYSALRHVINEHFDEVDKKHIPVTKNDLEDIQEILKGALIVDYVKPEFGNTRIVWEFKQAMFYYYIEEVRTGRNKIAMVSLYKRKIEFRKQFKNRSKDE